jgi:hypothetical protein
LTIDLVRPTIHPVRAHVLVAIGAVVASARASAAPMADLVIIWAPGHDVTPIASAAREAGAAVLDRSPVSAPVRIAAVLQRGIEAFEALHVDEAWATLEQARELVDRNGSADLSPAQLSDLFLYRALVLIQHGDPSAAWDQLAIAVVADPTRALDPARFAPSVIDDIARARAVVLARPRATVTFDAPTGCTFVIDGATAESGSTWLVGPHWMSAACLDHATWGKRIDVIEPVSHFVVRPRGLKPPSETDVLVQARASGARAVVVVETHASVATVRTIGLDGRERDRRSASVEMGLEPAATIVGELLRPAPRRPWYQSRWVWAAGAAGLAAIVLVPLTVAIAGGGGAPDATIRGKLP